MTGQFTVGVRCDAGVTLVFDLQIRTRRILGHGQMLEERLILAKQSRSIVQPAEVLPD